MVQKKKKMVKKEKRKKSGAALVAEKNFRAHRFEVVVTEVEERKEQPGVQVDGRCSWVVVVVGAVEMAAVKEWAAGFGQEQAGQRFQWQRPVQLQEALQRGRIASGNSWFASLISGGKKNG